jgi:kinetochor protein Mis14/NSL1
VRLSIMGSSIAVNCCVQCLDIEYEPLDTKLKERIALLEKQKESLTEKVADLRRAVPSQAAEGFTERWKSEDQAFEAQLKMLEDGENVGGSLQLGELKRLDEVRRTWERGTGGLIALKADLTETVAKLERAKGVVEHLEEKR